MKNRPFFQIKLANNRGFFEDPTPVSQVHREIAAKKDSCFFPKKAFLWPLQPKTQAGAGEILGTKND